MSETKEMKMPCPDPEGCKYFKEQLKPDRYWDMIEEIEALTQQRDDLLKACKELIFDVEIVDSSEKPTSKDISNMLDSIARARQAIKSAEGE